MREEPNQKASLVLAHLKVPQHPKASKNKVKTQETKDRALHISSHLVSV